MFAAAAAVSTVVIARAPFVVAAMVAVSPDVGVMTIESSVMTVEPTVKSVVASHVVKLAAAAVEPPMAPGAANVAPPSLEALRLATTVVEATTKGAVPVATSDSNV